MSNRWFIDTEFDENGTTVKLISIALVCEDGRELHMVMADGWRAEDCNEWVQANVLPHLPNERTPRIVAAQAIRLALQRDGSPEIWGYFSDYDWVVFCQLFGTMMDLPEGFPMYCLDLKQEMHRMCVGKDRLPPQSGTAHDALEDARWIRSAWFALQEME